MSGSSSIWIGLILLCGILLLELLAPHRISEGFQSIGAIPYYSKTSYFSQFVSKNVVANPIKEEAGYIMDGRYFHDYTDVQRLGVNQDYCRVVVPKAGGTLASNGKRVISSEAAAGSASSRSPDVTQSSAPETDESLSFFACALGGTDGKGTTLYKTNTVAKGLKLSRDDYMRDIMKEGRSAYCRIIKARDNTYQPMCRKAADLGFEDRDVADPLPPDDIKMLLNFYDGCTLWLRLRDDMKDYMGSVQIYTGGSLAIDETPRPSPTYGLSFDGVHQFMRIGDTPDLTLGSVVKLRTTRAFSVWVFFDEFTNNAHIFDFGDGAGRNNTFLGILGKGDPQVGGGAEIRPLLCGTGSTLPEGKTGQQRVQEVSPQEFMKTTAANVDECIDIDQQVEARILQPSSVRMPSPTGPSNKATLHYEVWDSQQRKMNIKVNSVIPLKQWVHIAVTAITEDATRPDIGIYVNGEMVFVQPSGFLPQAISTTNNYLGKSNWTDHTSSYELRDELFSGRMFDFRMYKTRMSDTKIRQTIRWGQELLGILPTDLSVTTPQRTAEDATAIRTAKIPKGWVEEMEPKTGAFYYIKEATGEKVMSLEEAIAHR